MHTARFEVLSPDEVARIHAASLAILAEVGIKVDYPTARDIFRSAGARVDDAAQVVRLPEDVLLRALAAAPRSFALHGLDPTVRYPIGPEQQGPLFAGLGTPTRIVDLDTGAIRPVSTADMLEHIILIDGLDHIHNSQMDVWPDDIPMTTIHAEAIWAWAHHSRKSFGMGCYGYLPTRDMMQMMALAVGGKEELRRRPRFLAICSVVSPLQMVQQQAEGLLICAEYGQPLAMSPEAIAGATAPATLAGLLAQENAAILAHIALAQIYRPGAPVLYGTVSTIANMRHGTVALGAAETGLITAASAQLARFYGLPCRSVGATTESKTPDVQAGVERMQTLLPAVLAGVNLITCGGTLDSTLLEHHALLVLDDEIAGSALRLSRGIAVNDDTLALDLIRQVKHSGNYLAEPHTVAHFRKEHYQPRLFVRDPWDTWEKAGCPTALDRARARAREILSRHTPRTLHPAIETELQAMRTTIAARSLDEFYSYELPEMQDLEAV
jgi:trimethylamine--corrinoid protein Co-methyltransferase